MSLSDVERRVLVNQYKILSALYPHEADHYDHLSRILVEGYHERWTEAIVGGLKKPLSNEDTDFVFDVLVMYDWMQKSYYSIPKRDRQYINEKRLRFPGFDSESESRLVDYARFLIQRLERFTFLNAAVSAAGKGPTRAAYARMLAVLPAREDRALTLDEIATLLDAGEGRPASSAPARPLRPPVVAAEVVPASDVPSALPQEVFTSTPELAAFEAALNASLARQTFAPCREERTMLATANGRR